MESIDSYTSADLSRALEDLGVPDRSRLLRKEDKFNALKKAGWNGMINGRRPEALKRRSSPRRSSPRRKSPARSSGKFQKREENLLTESDRPATSGETDVVREKLFTTPVEKRESSLQKLLKGEDEEEPDFSDQRMKELSITARLRALLDSKIFDTLTGKKKAQAREFIKNALDVLNTGNEYPQFTKAMLEKIFIDDQQMKQKGLIPKVSDHLNESAVGAVKDFLNKLFTHIPTSSGSSHYTLEDLFKTEKPLFTDEALIVMIDESIEALRKKAREVPLFSEEERKVIITEEFRRRNFFVSSSGEPIPGNNYPLTVDDLLNSSYNFERNKSYLLSLSTFLSSPEHKKLDNNLLTSSLGFDGFNDGVDLKDYSTNQILQLKGVEYQKLLEKKGESGADVSANIRFFLGRIRADYESQELDLFRNNVDNIEKLYTLIVQKRIEAKLDENKKKFNKRKWSFTKQALNYAAQCLLPVYLEVNVLDTLEKKALYYATYYKLGEDKINEVIQFFNDNVKKNKKELFDKVISMFIKSVKRGLKEVESELDSKLQIYGGSAGNFKVRQINEVLVNMALFNQATTVEGRLLIFLSNEKLFFDSKLLDEKKTSKEINVDTLVKLFDPELARKYMTIRGKADISTTATQPNVDLEVKSGASGHFKEINSSNVPNRDNQIIMNVLLNVSTCITSYYSKKVYSSDYSKIIKRLILLARDEIAPLENQIIMSSFIDKLNVLFNIMYLDRPIPYAEILNKCFNRIELKPGTSGVNLDEETEANFMLDNVKTIILNVVDKFVEVAPNSGRDTGIRQAGGGAGRLASKPEDYDSSKLSDLAKAEMKFFRNNFNFLSLQLFDAINSFSNCQKILKTVYNNIFLDKDDDKYFDSRVSFAGTIKLLSDSIYLVGIRSLKYLSGLIIEVIPVNGNRNIDNATVAGAVAIDENIKRIRSVVDEKIVISLGTLFKNAFVLNQILREERNYIKQVIKYFKSVKKDSQDEDDKKKLESRAVITNLKNINVLSHLFEGDRKYEVPEKVPDVDLGYDFAGKNFTDGVIQLLNAIMASVSKIKDQKDISSDLNKLYNSISSDIESYEDEINSKLGEKGHLSELSLDLKKLEAKYPEIKNIKEDDIRNIQRYAANVFLFFGNLISAVNELKSIIRIKSEKDEDKKKK